MNRKGSAVLVIVLVVVIVLIIAGGFWYYNVHSSLPSQQPISQTPIDTATTTTTNTSTTQTTSFVTSTKGSVLQPIINAISPVSITDIPQTITITGAGFTPQGNQFIFVPTNAPSSSIPRPLGYETKNPSELAFYNSAEFTGEQTGGSPSDGNSVSYIDGGLEDGLYVCGDEGAVGDGWECPTVDSVLATGTYMVYIENGDHEVSNGAMISVESPR